MKSFIIRLFAFLAICTVVNIGVQYQIRVNDAKTNAITALDQFKTGKGEEARDLLVTDNIRQNIWLRFAQVGFGIVAFGICFGKYFKESL